MFDQENHYIDPVTGFARHKDTDHLIGLEQAPPPRTNLDAEWPKMVVVHDSHVFRRKVDGEPDVISVPAWPNHSVNRVDGAVMVVVHDEDEEKLATSEYQAPKAEDVPADDESVRRAVRADIKRLRASQSESVAHQAAVDDARLEDEEVARRLAEQNELRIRKEEAAAKIASEQRKRLDDQLGHSTEAERLQAERRRAASDPNAHVG